MTVRAAASAGATLDLPSMVSPKQSEVQLQTRHLNELKALHEELKNLLREKYPDIRDQEFLGIAPFRRDKTEESS
jgi:hypothetical protein